MKKILFTVLAGLLICAGANAQYKLSSGNVPAGMEIVQVDQLPDMVRMYIKWTAPEDNYGFDVDDDAFVKLAGSFKKYKLIAAGNIPKTSDSAYAIARKAGDTIQFILEFEPFSLDGPFSVLEDSENDSRINLVDINLTNANLPQLDPKTFVLENPSLLKGHFAEGGISYSYWNYKGLAVIADFRKTNDDTHLFYIHLAILNNTGSDIAFDPASVIVEHENKNGRRNKLKVFTPKEYENRMNTENFFNALGKVASAISMVESVGKVVTGGQLFSTSSVFSTPVGGYIGMMNSQANIDRLNGVLSQMKDEYLVAGTVPDGGSHGGYLCLNEKKGGYYQITVPLIGESFTFTLEE